MRIDYAPRCSGKTARMIKWLEEDSNHILIVHTIGYKETLKEQHPEHRERILAAHEDIGMKTSHESTLGFDNLDLILQHMFKRSIGIASITKGVNG